MYMTNPTGFEFLAAQYYHNQLFIYPEHRDHDPGYNGSNEGYGDLYCSNLPCVLITQGSSGSDQPFLQALLATTAAFSPDVQSEIIRLNCLAPTLQAILRKSSKLVQTEQDYFTGKAHPPAFNSAHLNERVMVEAARLMTPLTIPPVAWLQVEEEAKDEPGIQFFEISSVTSSRLGTIPSCVSRIYRTSAPEYRIHLNGTRSVDHQRRPLTLSWHLLQGDPQYVKIEPQDDGTTAKIRIRWHELPLSAAGLRTHRVDIGLFVNNGFTTSAPAIFSLYLIPHEQRFYDEKNRLTEICYASTDTELHLPLSDIDLRWTSLLQVLASPKHPLQKDLLYQVYSTEQIKHASQAWTKIRALQLEISEMEKDPSLKSNTDRAKQQLSLQLRDAILTKLKDKGQEKTFRAITQRALNAIANLPELYQAVQDNLAKAAALSSKPNALAEVSSQAKRLSDWKIFQATSTGRLHLGREEGALTSAERSYIRQLNLNLLAQIILPDFFTRSPKPNFTITAFSQPKNWRDVYHYSPQGKLSGWTRYSQGKLYEFNTQGEVIEDNTARSVKYLTEGEWVVWK
jgi:hypothetical protein